MNIEGISTVLVVCPDRTVFYYYFSSFSPLQISTDAADFGETQYTKASIFSPILDKETTRYAVLPRAYDLCPVDGLTIDWLSSLYGRVDLSLGDRLDSAERKASCLDVRARKEFDSLNRDRAERGEGEVKGGAAAVMAQSIVQKLLAQVA